MVSSSKPKILMPCILISSCSCTRSWHLCSEYSCIFLGTCFSESLWIIGINLVCFPESSCLIAHCHLRFIDVLCFIVIFNFILQILSAFKFFDHFQRYYPVHSKLYSCTSLKVESFQKSIDSIIFFCAHLNSLNHLQISKPCLRGYNY